MEIKKQLEKAHEELLDKFSVYLKAEQKLTEEANGFFNKKTLDDMIKAKSDWQEASNKYYGLLSYLSKNKDLL